MVCPLVQIQSGKEKDIIATESTKEHEKIAIKAFIFQCSFVGFVAIKKITGNKKPGIARFSLMRHVQITSLYNGLFSGIALRTIDQFDIGHWRIVT